MSTSVRFIGAAVRSIRRPRFHTFSCFRPVSNRIGQHFFPVSNDWKLMRRIFQSLEKSSGFFPTIGKTIAGLFLAVLLVPEAHGQSDYVLVSNAVNAVRLELESALGKTVPSLSIYLQTSNKTIFACSAATPEQASATNTSLRFASNTKNFTSAAVLHLQQRGRLNITNRIVDMLPWTNQPYVPDGTNWAIPYKEQITIEQLLQHSAGVYDVDNDPVPGCGGDSYVGWMREQNAAHQFTPAELLGVVAFHQLSYFEPGSGYHYSDTGYSLLAAIVGRIYSLETGRDKNLTDYLYDYGIAEPDTRFPYLATNTALPEPYMPGTVYLPSNVTEVISNYNVSPHVGEGNGYGSLAALNRHIRSIMKGQSVLNNDMVYLMQTATSVSNGNYGLGCRFTPDLGFGHGGAVAGYLTLMFYNPDTDVSMAGCLPLWDMSDGMHTLVRCNQGLNDAVYRSIESLGYPRTPILAHGVQTNLTLTAGVTNTLYVNAVGGACYAFIFSNAAADVYAGMAPAVNPDAAQRFTNTFTWPCMTLGTYRLSLTTTADTPCSLTLTGLKLPQEADYSDLDWTQAFNAAHETFSRQYAFTDWKSVDWGALYSNTLPRIVAAQAATNEVQYFAALNAYAGAIPDSHIFFATTNTAVPEAWAQQVAGGGYGLAAAELHDGRVIAAALLTNGPAQLAGIQPGAEIVRWNGLDTTSAIAQIDVAAYPLKTLAGQMTLSPQATLEHERLEQARLLVRDPVGTNAAVQYVNPGSTVTQTVVLTANADTNATFGLLNYAWMQDPADPPVEYRILSNGLGYLVIRLEDNADDALSNMTEAVSTFAASNVPGVIVDVRGNLGGDDALAAELCGYFYRTNVFYERQKWYNTLDGTFTEFTVDTMNGEQWVDHLAIEPQSAYYGGPLAVLVNPGTVSSGEGLAMGIGNLPHAAVIGFHGTDGSFGMAGARIWMPGGHLISYPFGQSLDANGVIQLDSRNGVGGVAPSMRIPLTASNVPAYAGGEDVVLNAATDYLLTLPALPVGQTVTGTLAAGQAATYRCEVSVPVHHGIYCSATGLLVNITGLSDPADLSQPGSYTLALANPTASALPYTLRLYNFTNAIASISSYITNTMAAHNIPGMAVSVVDNADIVMADGFGFANIEKQVPVNGDTIFNIGSVSKTFTAVAAMTLVDDGLLDLDAPITHYLPELILRERFTNNPPMTARHMLAHLSGLPGDYFNGADNLWPTVSSDVTRIMAALTNDYPAMPTAFMPIYCNNGWEVLEQLVVDLGGASFDDYMATNVFQRLDMTRSATRHNAVTLGTNIVVPYNGEGKAAPYEYVAAEGAGGISSTARDMAQFMQMLLGQGVGANGRRVLSANAIHAMFEPQVTNTTLALPWNSSFSHFYPGLGWDSVLSETFTFAGRYGIKGGDVTYEHAGLGVLPDAGLGLSIHMNGSGIDQYDLVDQCLRYATLDKLGNYGPTNPITPVFSPITNWNAAALEALAGQYAGEHGVSIVAADTNSGTLTLTVNVQSEKSYALTGLVPRANGWFSSPTSQVSQFRFTNVLDQTCLILRQVSADCHRELLYAQRFDPVPLSAAWSNRTGIWIAIDPAPGSYISYLCNGPYKMSIHEGIFYLNEIMALQPVNDRLALAPYYGYRSSVALQVDPLDDRFMQYGDVRLQRLDDQPLLAQGAATNGIITGNETLWYRVPAASGEVFIVDLETTNHLQATAYQDGYAQGIAGPAHALQVACRSDGEIILTVQRNGVQTGDFRLAIRTNTLPFYAEVPFDQWPAALAAHSNLFPDTEFGYVYVHENRTNQIGHVLKIAVACMRSANPAAQPLFYCNGGPGDSSIRCVYQYYEKLFADDYDVYLIDQRGLGYSLPDLAFRNDESPAAAQYRVGMLSGLDLSTINTLESSYDLDDIAQVHGLTNVNLHGISYGTLLAQTLMRRDPPWLRAVVLDGVVAPNIPALNEGGPIMKEALDALFAGVAASTAPYPALSAEFYALGHQLQADPVRIVLPALTNTVDGVAFVNAALAQLTASDLSTRERIPNIVWRAWRGETAALAELYTRWNIDTNNMIRNSESELMGNMVFRHDFLPFNSLAGVSNACAPLPEPLRTHAIQYDGDIIIAAAALADAGQVGPDFALPVTSAIPTLVINGTFDTQTGTNWAAEVASHLPNSYLVTVPTAGHGVLAAGACPRGIVRAFLADPAQAPDTSCLAGMALDYPPPWPSNTASLAAGTGATNTFTQSGQGAWYALQAQADTWYTLHAGSKDGRQALYLVNTNAAILTGATNHTLRWRCAQSDTYYLWLVGQTSDTFTVRYTAAPHAGHVVDDFDGDGKTDVAVYWPEGGNWYLDQSSGGGAVRNWGWEAAMPVPADYDGDGCCDVTVYEPDTGTWYVHYSSGGSHAFTWGWNETIPAPGDFDGDGRTDITVYHPVSGTWYIRQSASGTLREENWGWMDALPAPADYDGDGLCDLCVFHPAAGQWYLRLSGSGQFEQRSWGWRDTVPVPADYDGDGRADTAVYWPEQGMWFILGSGGAGPILQWGWPGAIPLPGDYDGDGRADVTVYDQADGAWYIRRSSDGRLDQRTWGWSDAYGVWPQYWINR